MRFFMKQVVFLSVALLLSFNVRTEDAATKCFVQAALEKCPVMKAKFAAFENAPVWNKIDEARRAEVKQFTMSLMAFPDFSADELKKAFAKHNLGLCEGRIEDLTELVIQSRQNPEAIALLTKGEKPAVVQDEKLEIVAEAVTTDSKKEEITKEENSCSKLLVEKAASVESNPNESPLADKATEQKN